MTETMIPPDTEAPTAHNVAGQDEIEHAFLELLGAGRELATLVQEDIDACGNAPPHPDDCPDCRRHREALFTWAQKVWATRKALALVTPIEDHDLPKDHGPPLDCPDCQQAYYCLQHARSRRCL